jgi:Lon protease-like protein
MLSTAMADLPTILPIFPLTGSLLLPGNWLPLHIFEPRYRNMVEDAFSGRGPGEGEKLIGMVQPLAPHEGGGVDLSALDPGMEPDLPELYQVGCVGRIEECQEVAEGRYLIALLGVTRFRIAEELPLKRGYRRVRAVYEEFAHDRESPQDQDAAPESLIRLLTEFGKLHGLSFDMRRLGKLPCQALVNGLSMALPFEPAEKQALLEAPNDSRLDVLEALLQMGVDLRSDEAETGTPIPN